MKIHRLFLVLFLIALISITPVNAFWWLFKSEVKQTEKQIIKQVEKAETKQIEKATAKQEEKIITKQEQMQTNRITGNLIDDAFKTQWCKTHVCAKSVYEFDKLKHPGSTIYIIDDWEAKKYINNKFDSSFTRRPDMLMIKARPGSNYIQKVVVYDTKTSANAISASDMRGQGGDYEKLCNSLNAKNGRSFCDVQYILPKDEAEQVVKTTDNSILGCLVVGFIAFGPDPTDLLCFVG